MAKRTAQGENRAEQSLGGVASRESVESAPTSSLSKGLLVVEALIESENPVSLSTLVRNTGLPKTTVHRLVGVLLERGWVKETGRGYGLGYVPLRAAASIENSLDVRQEAHPFLCKLRDELEETVHLAALDQECRVVYLEKLVPRSQAVGLMQSRVGWTAPAYCTGVGKAMLACLSENAVESFFRNVQFVPYTAKTIVSRADFEVELERVRRAGYAICDGEHEHGVSCIAAAIRNRHGDPIAAISVSGPTDRMSPHLDAGSVSVVRLCEAADALSRLFGGRTSF